MNSYCLNIKVFPVQVSLIGDTPFFAYPEGFVFRRLATGIGLPGDGAVLVLEGPGRTVRAEGSQPDRDDGGLLDGTVAAVVVEVGGCEAGVGGVNLDRGRSSGSIVLVTATTPKTLVS
jgi:hypothetical protein